MKNKTYVIVVIFILLLPKCGSKTKDISMELDNIILDSKSDTVYFKFSDFIDSNYDKFLILPPYARIRWVEKNLESNLDKVKKLGIERRDDICVLCFFKNNVLKEYKIINRNSIDWSSVNDFKFIEKNTEFIIVKQQGKYHVEKTR